jgi:hypothetical protein
MQANAWQSPFCGRAGISEDVLNALDRGLLTLRNLHLDHIETPRNLACAEAAQPFVRTALDESPLFAVYGRQPSHFRVLLPGFHLDKKQLPALTGDDINLAALPALEVPSQDLAVPHAQPVGGDLFPVVTRPLTRSARTRPWAVGRV